MHYSLFRIGFFLPILILRSSIPIDYYSRRRLAKDRHEFNTDLDAGIQSHAVSRIAADSFTEVIHESWNFFSPVQ